MNDNNNEKEKTKQLIKKEDFIAMRVSIGLFDLPTYIITCVFTLDSIHICTLVKFAGNRFQEVTKYRFMNEVIANTKYTAVVSVGNFILTCKY